MAAKIEAPRLFYDNFEDAASQVVAACGGPKAVGAFLWPTKSADSARTRLLDCLNPKEPDKLAPEEIIALAKMGRDRGCHAIAEWLNFEAGYAPPTPVDPDDTRAELQRQFHTDVDRLERIAQSIRAR
jgi:hypothetical protein